MLDHARAQDLAAAAIDFDLAVDERAELDGHLAACPACRAYAGGLERDARMLAERPRAAAPERVARRITRDARPAWGARSRLAAAAVGIVVVAVVRRAIKQLLDGIVTESERRAAAANG